MLDCTVDNWNRGAAVLTLSSKGGVERQLLMQPSNPFGGSKAARCVFLMR